MLRKVGYKCPICGGSLYEQSDVGFVDLWACTICHITETPYAWVSRAEGIKNCSKEGEYMNSLESADLGKATEVVFSFDTTGSMSPVIDDVRTQLREMIVRMSKDIPHLRIGVIAHGDYCDGPDCIKVLDLTNDHDKVIEFVENAPNTSGGDVDECYELVLHEARKLSWSGKDGVFVMIGDASPHGSAYPMNEKHLDWKEELQELIKITKVYAMQCMRSGSHYGSNQFWDSVASLAGTSLLRLDNLQEAAVNLEGVAYAAHARATHDTGVMRMYSSSLADRGIDMDMIGSLGCNMSSLTDDLVADLNKETDSGK